MLCAEDEIGLGKNHNGIIVLPDDAVVGTQAKDYYHVRSDYVLEVDITPNRVDGTSHFGVARDLYAYLRRHGQQVRLSRPSVQAFGVEETEAPLIRVEVEDAEGCPRYSGVSIKGVKVQESPEWLQNRLKSIGLRPINNIVDVTNFVLHEMGQPLHAFDLSRITGGKVIVRTVADGTRFVTLDGVERTLTADDLMICNTAEPMCIAGVFGGLGSGVTEQTTDVFLESATFHPTRIRKTARRFGLNTDASFRYERGLDANATLYALQRAALLMKELAGGVITGEVQDVYPVPAKPYPVSLSYHKLTSLTGKEIPKELVKVILESLEIAIVAETEEALQLQVPVYRIDVRRDVDVIEEILRIYGYNHIETGDSLKSNLSYRTATDRSADLQHLVSEQLCGYGFREVMNNSLTRHAHYEALTSYPAAQCVMLLNPLSADLNCMRQTLLFGGLESIDYNIKRKSGDIRFFEFGNCYAQASAEGALPQEDYRLGLWLCGNRVSNHWAHADEKASVYELKACVENLLDRLGVSRNRLKYESLSNDIYASGLSLTLSPDRHLGSIGIIRKKIAKALDIDVEIYYAELSWTLLMKETAKCRITFGDIPAIPAVKRDLALLLDSSVRFADVEKLAHEAERKLLQSVTLFDVYEGKNLPEGKKSYAVSFYLQDPTRTLTDGQIETVMHNIQSRLAQHLGAQLR
jgi:phenylalanyl-tRNA synthetase beta chain